MKIDNVENLVKQALIKNKSARDDDHLLYIEVVYIIDPALVNVNFMMNFKSAKQLGLPPFESVSRARRKLQEKYPELRATSKVEKARQEKQIEFEEYAKT